MKLRIRIPLILLTLALALLSDGRFSSVASSPAVQDGLERLRFRIKTIEERAGERNVISDATVEGPAGTDFDISLHGGRFKMYARFLTDLIEHDSLKVRAKLETRRLYGYSQQNLPLYEEDNQNQTLQLGFDESVVLLPFGRGGGGDSLKIEITPEVSQQSSSLPSGKTRPLEIKILKTSPGGIINIQAFKIPHRYAVEATLLEDGREVARSSADYLIEESKELILNPTAEAGPEVTNNPLAVSFTINQYTRSRPVDEATIGFDIYRMNQQTGSKESIGLNWAGMGALGSQMTYDLSDVYMKGSGKKYELRFKVNLAQGERAD